MLELQREARHSGAAIAKLGDKPEGADYKGCSEYAAK